MSPASALRAGLLAALLVFVRPVPAAVPVEPYNWESVRIGAGGFVTGMAVHPLDANVRFARTDVGNAYRWDAAAQIWRPIIVRQVENGEGLPADIGAVPASLGVESLAVDPSNTGIVYLAFGLGRSNDVASIAPASSGTLYKSLDGGLTFARTGLDLPMAANGPTRALGERLAVDPANGSVVYYGSVSSGLRRSLDGGANWTLVAGGGPAAGANVLTVQFDRASGTVQVNGQTRTAVLYAIVFAGEILRSSDGGESWTAITGGTALSGQAGFSAIDSTGRLLVVRTRSKELWAYAAGAWTTRNVPSNYNLGGVTVDVANPQRLFTIGDGGGLCRSLDGGLTWVRLSSNYTFANAVGWLPQRISGFRANGGLYLDRDGRLWSPQGNEGVLTWRPAAGDPEGANSNPAWTIQSEGIEEFVAHDIVLPPGSGDRAVVSVEDATAFFIDDPDQFTAAQAPLQNQLISNGVGLAYCPNAPTFVAVSSSDVNFTGSGGNYSGFSSDGGRTWSPFPSTPPGPCGQLAVSRRGAWGLGDDHLVVLPSNSRPPSYTLDGGRTWLPSAGLPVNADGALADGGMFTFALRQRLLHADPLVPDKYYLALLSGPLYVSTDGGASWASAGGVGLPIGRFHSQLAVNPTHAGDLWFADGWEGAFGTAQPHGLYRSTDGGVNFVRNPAVDYAITLALGAGRGQAGDAAFTVYVYGKLAAESVWGVFRSTDAGISWTRVAYNPAGLFDRPSSMAASWDTFGLLYIGYCGSSFVYGRPGSPTAPAFTQQPANQTAALADVVTFSATATGAPRPGYRWQRQASGSTAWVDVPGANGRSLTFAASAADNAARYRVVAFNDRGSATSVEATLALPPLTALASADRLAGTFPLTVQFTGQAVGGRLGPNRDTTDDGLGTISARGENASNGEGARQAFDNSPDTKWLDFSPDPARASFLEYAYPPGTRLRVQRYTVTSANDAPARDPADWALLGSNDGVQWTTLDTRQAESFGSRLLRRSFAVAQPGSFQRYRLRIDRVADPSTAICVQLAELELIEEPAYTYAWNFGDGGTSTLRNPGHVFAAPGAYQVTLTVTDANGDIATSTLTVNTRTAFDTWRVERFSQTEPLDPTVSGPTSDPDRDGLANLLEFALDLNPAAPDPASRLPSVQRDANGRATLTFFRARAAAELIYTVQTSGDLASWTDLATNPGLPGQSVTVTDTAPGNAPRRFLRLRVAVP